MEKNKYTVLLEIIVGAVASLINFPMAWVQFAEAELGDLWIGKLVISLIIKAQALTEHFIGTDPYRVFYIMVKYLFVGLYVYIVFLFAFSLYYRKLSFLLIGTTSLVSGSFVVPAIAWTIVIAVRVFAVLRKIIQATIVEYMLILVVSVWLLYLLAIAIYKIIINWKRVLLVLTSLSFGAVLWVIAKDKIMRATDLIVRFVVWIFYDVLSPVESWLWHVVIEVVFVHLLYLYIFFASLANFGRMVMDPLPAAWHAGNGKKGVALGAFGIGVTFSFIVVTSMANSLLVNTINKGFWSALIFIGDTQKVIDLHVLSSVDIMGIFTQAFPKEARHFIFQYFVTTSAPIFDTTLLILVTIVSYIGLLRGMYFGLGLHPEPSYVKFHSSEIFSIASGILEQLVAVFVQQMSDQSHAYSQEHTL